MALQSRLVAWALGVIQLASHQSPTGPTLTLTGTLFETGVAGAFSYVDVPRDRLQVRTLDGGTAVFTVRSLTGRPDLTPGYLLEDHELTFDAQVNGTVAVRITSRRTAGTTGDLISGSTLRDGGLAEVVDLAELGQEVGAANGDLWELDRQRRGTVQGEDGTLVVREETSVRLARAGPSCPVLTQRLDSALYTLGVDSLAFRGVELSVPCPLGGAFTAHGSLVQSNAVVGQVLTRTVLLGTGATARAFLKLDGGTEVPLGDALAPP